jgi:hypothetical protein
MFEAKRDIRRQHIRLKTLQNANKGRCRCGPCDLHWQRAAS